jgi:hypothetical protein
LQAARAPELAKSPRPDLKISSRRSLETSDNFDGMDARARHDRISPPADSLAPPAGLDRYAVLRSLDRERFADEAPDVPAARRARIVKIRDEIRRGVYANPHRLAVATERLLRALEGGDCLERR